MKKNYQNKTYYSQKNRMLDRHKYIIKLIEKSFKKNDKIEIIDFGCGSGELAFFLNQSFPKSTYLGIDIDQSLIRLAKKKKINNSTFQDKSLLEFTQKKKYDVVIACGMLSFFSDFKPILKKVISFLKNSNSKVYIFGRFNSANIDTKIQIRDNTESNSWREGFNSYSTKTISLFLKRFNKKFRFIKFNLKVNLKKGKSLTRTFTILNKNKKMILNRANIIAEFFFLIIKK